MREVEIRLKEKKMKSLREKIKREQEMKCRQQIKTFVKQNSSVQPAQKCLEEIVEYPDDQIKETNIT